jgi:hypothetical protein
MVLLGDVGQVEPHFGPFGDSVNIGASRCSVCAERTIALEIILDVTDGTPR